MEYSLTISIIFLICSLFSLKKKKKKGLFHSRSFNLIFEIIIFMINLFIKVKKIIFRILFQISNLHFYDHHHFNYKQ